VEHRPSPGNQRVPRRLIAPDPQRGDPSRGNPRTKRGVPSARFYSGPQASRMVVAHFFESGQRTPSRWGRVESAPANGRRSSAGSTVYIAAIDEKAGRGPRRLGPGVQGSHSVSRLPRRQLESRVTRGPQVESSFWSGGWDPAQLRAGRGQGCSPATDPEGLERLGSSLRLS